MATASISAESENGSNLELPAEQLQCLSEIKQWIKTDVKFNGRTDDDFLLMFLRACEFDINLTKKTYNYYYVSRRDIPQWWANRNVLDKNIFPLLQLKRSMAVMEKGENHPTVAITISARLGENLGNFDDYMKMMSIYTEVVARRRNSQKNGVIWIVDSKNVKRWFALRHMSPLFAKRFVFSFAKSLSCRLNKVIVINSSAIVSAVVMLSMPFIPENYKEKLLCFGSNWSNLGNYVPMEIMPEEFGGQAGPMEKHEEAFMNEVLAFNDYLMDDNKYGYQCD